MQELQKDCREDAVPCLQDKRHDNKLSGSRYYIRHRVRDSKKAGDNSSGQICHKGLVLKEIHMKVNIISDKHNPFLKRKEIAAEIEHESEASPRKDALQQWISKELKTDVDKVEIKHIFTETGLPKSRAKVFVWEEKVMKKSEPQKKEEKKEQETKQEKKEEKQE